MQNGFIKSSNSQMRDVTQRDHVPQPGANARRDGAWTDDYNTGRPHLTLVNQSPADYARDLTNELMRLADTMAVSPESFEEGQPKPRPSLRVRPDL